MNPRSQCMLTVFDRRQELMENMMIVCLYVSEQLIICMLTQLSEALAQIPSVCELFTMGSQYSEGISSLSASG